MKTADPTLSEWIAPPGAPALDPGSLSLGDTLSQAARKWGSRQAIIYRHQPAIADVAWTYAELNHHAERLAAALIATGYLPGERIAIWGPNHPEWVLLEYAIAKAGLILVALNPLYKINELAFALQDSRAAGIFHADRIGVTRPAEIIDQARRDTPALRHIHAFSSIWTELIPRAPDDFPHVATDPDATFMIQYTSGTTGVPKAVRLSHRAIMTTALNSYRMWGIEEGSRVCPGFPLFHVGGSGNSIPGAVAAGATVLPLHIFKPHLTLDVLEHERCSTFVGVPTMLIAMLDDPSIAGRSLDALKTIIVGGAPVTNDLLKRCRNIFGADVINCYGQTETCGVTTTTLSTDSADKKTRTSGAALIGVSIAIRDEQGRSVRRGRIGELHYQGPGGMQGYGSTPCDGDISDGPAWIASGDLATMDDDGFVAIVGRKKEMIIRGGENLSPVEIEAYMKEHPAIREVAVVGVPDEKYGEVACAAVSVRSGMEITSKQIREWCIDRISLWKVPEYIEFLDEFPMTPSGKIQKFQIKEEMVQRLNLA
ncbi:class I adenylate-forming enzyme family protein [Sphingomonas sp. KC8]|nr:AMP-binding protein [Sphingomonas sp. KC8]ARS29472.1 AMP-dependent synthetase [Sphingomonas sp. KC8]